ncbi:MAG: hypothetical protein AAGF77_10410 [Bacteroidota bacterium]
MKKLLYVALVLAISFASCEKEDGNESVVSADSQDRLSIKAIASKMKAQLPPAETEAVIQAYRSLTYEEFKEYIEVFYTNMIDDGVDKARAALTKALMSEVNDAIYELHGKSYASVDLDLGVEVYEGFVAKEKYAPINISKAAKKFSKEPDCAVYPFNKEISIGWTTTPTDLELSFPSDIQDFNYWGAFNFYGDSDDCDLVFFSISYSPIYTASRLKALTPQAQLVLGWTGIVSTGVFGEIDPNGVVPFNEVLQDDNTLRTDFGTGAGRIGYVYPNFLGTTNSAISFVNDVKLLVKER